jgi:hypothetical protein
MSGRTVADETDEERATRWMCMHTEYAKNDSMRAALVALIREVRVEESSTDLRAIAKVFIERAEELGESCPWCGAKMRHHWEDSECLLVRTAERHGLR